MTEVVNVKESIEGTIREILIDYKKNERKYTTEGDVTAHLFARLSEVFRENDNIVVHSQDCGEKNQ